MHLADLTDLHCIQDICVQLMHSVGDNPKAKIICRPERLSRGNYCQTRLLKWTWIQRLRFV